MIDLLEYFKENVENNDYYKNHYFSIKDVEDIRDKNYFYNYYDDQEVIDAFKDVVKPENEKNISIELEEKYILICFYLNDQGYVIQEFPDVLKRPKTTEKSDLYDFMYRQIRTYIINHNKNNSGIVTWDERRTLIDSLHFIKNRFNVSSEMDELIIKITNEDKSFNELNEDSKLEAICNSIEYLLKRDKIFDKIDCSKFFDIISNENITKLRKILQCYRHATKEDIRMRENIDEKQKLFLIRYGIVVIEMILDI